MPYKDKQSEEKWKREHTTRIHLRLNNNTDKELIEFLNSTPNRQGLIKQLLNEYIEAQKKK